jgi:pseudouridine synthase
MKLVQYIARSTGLSRRQVMEMIREGRVEVDDRIESSATRPVDPARSRVCLDGKLIRSLPDLHLALYKPRATICTRSDPEGRPTVYDLVERPHRRAVTVGRLDYHTTGLILLTTDGELAQRLMRPDHAVERSYRVRIRGEVTAEVLDGWRRGLRIRGRRTRPARVRILEHRGSTTLLSVTLVEGMNRQIHEMARATRLVVAKIQRVRFGTVALGHLRPGQYRQLAPAEVVRLRRLVKL